MRFVAAVVLVAASMLLFSLVRDARARRSKAGRSVEPFIPPGTLAHLDWVRGLAAVAVLFGHVRGLVLLDYEAVRGGAKWLPGFYLLSGLGHQAVIVFFILSGFFIGMTVIGASDAGRWSWKGYAIRRLARLYTVLLPGLLLTAVWDGLGISLFGIEGTIYAGKIDARHLSLPDVRQTLTWPALLGNLAFVQHLVVPGFGSNNPLWSLSLEFWSYVLLPIVVRAVAAERMATKLAGAGLACGILIAFGTELSFYFAIWMLGATAALLWQWRPIAFSNPIVTGLSLSSFAGSLLLGRSRLLDPSYADLLLGSACAATLLVLLARGASRPLPGARYRAAGSWIAGISFTLYVAHYPLLTFAHAASLEGSRLFPSLPAIGLVIGVTLLVVFLYAYPLASLTEARTERVRAWLYKLTSVQKRPAPSIGA